MKNRRCDSTGCMVTAAHKGTQFNVNLPIASILDNPARDWKSLTLGNKRVASTRTINIDWSKLNPDDYLFTHCSIVSSVNTTDNGYSIEAPTDELVNNNGNAWTTPVLLATFKSFIGAENYYEHQQIPALSKGKILDAVLRPVVYKSKETDQTANVLYCDILVATSKKHNELVSRIINGELTTLSMGGIAHVVQCSKCGKEFSNDDSCSHLDNELMTYYKAKDGKERIVAELCGRSYIDQTTGQRVGDPTSFEFIEASWVENPAFRGAVLNHYVSQIEDEKKFASVMNMPSRNLEDLYSELSSLKVADANGRMVLKIAREELKRRKSKSELIDRVTIWAKNQQS